MKVTKAMMKANKTKPKLSRANPVKHYPLYDYMRMKEKLQR